MRTLDERSSGVQIRRFWGPYGQLVRPNSIVILRRYKTLPRSSQANAFEMTVVLLGRREAKAENEPTDSRSFATPNVSGLPKTEGNLANLLSDCGTLRNLPAKQNVRIATFSQEREFLLRRRFRFVRRRSRRLRGANDRLDQQENSGSLPIISDGEKRFQPVPVGGGPAYVRCNTWCNSCRHIACGLDFLRFAGGRWRTVDPEVAGSSPVDLAKRSRKRRSFTGSCSSGVEAQLRLGILRRQGISPSPTSSCCGAPEVDKVEWYCRRGKRRISWEKAR
jgi:hypothetical protein